MNFEITNNIHSNTNQMNSNNSQKPLKNEKNENSFKKHILSNNLEE